MPAKKIRKKRAKRVNWVYVVENSTDILHVADFTIATTAEAQPAGESGDPSSSAEISVVEPSMDSAERVSSGATSIARKKRAKKVNWEYVVENNSDILTVADTPIAITAVTKPRVESGDPFRAMQGTFTPVTKCCPAMNRLRHGWAYYLDPTRDVPATPDEWKVSTSRMTYWGTHYDELAEKQADMSVYDRLAREHLNRQSTIAEDLVKALKANVCRSYRDLSKVVNG